MEKNDTVPISHTIHKRNFRSINKLNIEAIGKVFRI